MVAVRSRMVVVTSSAVQKAPSTPARRILSVLPKEPTWTTAVGVMGSWLR